MHGKKVLKKHDLQNENLQNLYCYKIFFLLFSMYWRFNIDKKESFPLYLILWWKIQKMNK